MVSSLLVALLVGLAGLTVLPRTIGASWILGLQLEAGALALTAVYQVALYSARALNRSRYFVILYLLNAVASIILTVLLSLCFGGMPTESSGRILPRRSFSYLPPSTFGARSGTSPVFVPASAAHGTLWAADRSDPTGDWVLTFSDRLFVQALAGTAQLGVYSLGYRLGSVEQQLVVGGFQLAWDPLS
jgi:hypothetical protein